MIPDISGYSQESLVLSHQIYLFSIWSFLVEIPRLLISYGKVTINNYLNHGAIRERFHTDPDMKKGEELLTSENLFNKENIKP